MNKEEYNAVCQRIESAYLALTDPAEAAKKLRELRNYVDSTLESDWLPLPAGFNSGSPLADAIREDEAKRKKAFDDSKPHTFQEWSENGYRIRKGEHATGKDKAGTFTFTRDQVYENRDRVVAQYSSYGIDNTDFEFDGDSFDQY